MVQQQGIIKGDVLQRIGSVGFIIGAILLVICHFLIPHSSPGNPQDLLRPYGQQPGLTTMFALLYAVGFWGLMIGWVGVYRSISTGGAAAWARLGFYGVVVGTTLYTISWALLMATAARAAIWLAAPDAAKIAAVHAAGALYAAFWAMQAMRIIVYWLALVFLGIGMVLSAVYPRWMGWVVIVLGIVQMVVGGFIPLFGGPPSATSMIFDVLLALTGLWALVIGIWVARKAW